MNIRKMEQKDYVQVKVLQTQIHNKHIAARPDIYLSGVETMGVEYFDSLINDDNGLNFVVEDGDKIVGCVLANYKPASKVPIIKTRKVIYIDSIVVDSAHQHQGIGKQLFLHLEKIAKANNVDSIELNVLAFNDSAIKFYESLGMNTQSYKFEKRYK